MTCNFHELPKQEGNVEFISYDGKWPNLCNGLLTLKIEGEEVRFGMPQNILTGSQIRRYVLRPDFNPNFWISGGSVSVEDDEAKKGEWRTDVSKIPLKYQKYAKAMDEILNKNVPYGCCGGCL